MLLCCRNSARPRHKMRARINPKWDFRFKGKKVRMREDFFGQFWIACSKINLECCPEKHREKINKYGHLIGHYVKYFSLRLCFTEDLE